MESAMDNLLFKVGDVVHIRHENDLARNYRRAEPHEGILYDVPPFGMTPEMVELCGEKAAITAASRINVDGKVESEYVIDIDEWSFSWSDEMFKEGV
jgi:hypothetical protein